MKEMPMVEMQSTIVAKDLDLSFWTSWSSIWEPQQR